MANCPAGYELEEVFQRLGCRSCGRQCIIRYLLAEISRLENKIDALKE